MLLFFLNSRQHTAFSFKTTHNLPHFQLGFWWSSSILVPVTRTARTKVSAASCSHFCWTVSLRRWWKLPPPIQVTDPHTPQFSRSSSDCLGMSSSCSMDVIFRKEELGLLISTSKCKNNRPFLGKSINLKLCEDRPKLAFNLRRNFNNVITVLHGLRHLWQQWALMFGLDGHLVTKVSTSRRGSLISCHGQLYPVRLSWSQGEQDFSPTPSLWWSACPVILLAFLSIEAKLIYVFCAWPGDFITSEALSCSCSSPPEAFKTWWEECTEEEKMVPLEDGSHLSHSMLECMA